jgi:hypothetical protein
VTRASPLRAQVWRTLALVYRAIDARRGGGRGSHRIQRQVEPDELQATLHVLHRVPAAVESWSEGAARIDPLEIVVIDRAVGTLSETGGRTWLGPGDCRPELDRLAGPGRRDAIIGVWPSDGSLELCGWGCTIGPGPEANGAGFSSIVSDAWRSYASAVHPEEGFVHEWLHQVEATYRDLGFGEDVFPPLHDAEILTSCRPTDEPPHGRTYRALHDRSGETWQVWYRDYMTGRVLRPDGSGCFGLAPGVWSARRTISGGGSGPSGPPQPRGMPATRVGRPGSRRRDPTSGAGSSR